jgi:serine/threonine protein kinase
MHSKGILHRDIKPGNILLHSDPDGNLVVKICDFGIAVAGEQVRALSTVTQYDPKRTAGASATNGTLCVDQTAAGPMATTLLQTNTRGLKAQVGTLPYMSPEQVAVAMAESSRRPSLYFLWGITNEIQRGASK